MVLNGLSSTVLATPGGSLALVTDADGALVAAGFCPVGDLETRLQAPTVPRTELGAVSRALAAYVGGELAAVDDIVCHQRGTALQQRVWTALRAIPAGTTSTYGELAARLALSPGTARAIGSACGKNLIAPVVPCHRVVRGNGSLGGYYYGLPAKRWLLAHERA